MRVAQDEVAGGGDEEPRVTKAIEPRVVRLEANLPSGLEGVVIKGSSLSVRH